MGGSAIAGIVQRQGLKIQASLRIAVIQIAGGQQAMTLRPDVANLENHVATDLALDCEVVLLLVLGPDVRLQFAVQDHGAEQ